MKESLYRQVGFWLVAAICYPALALAQAPRSPSEPSTGTFPSDPPSAHTPATAPPAPPAPHPTPDPALEPPPAADSSEPVPIVTPAPAASPAERTGPPRIAEPPPPPPLSTDTRSNRVKRPFFIGGELGWNGLAGFGANFSYHPNPHFALDTALGLSLPGLRIGVRARANFLESEWTPFVGAGFTYAGGSGGQALELQTQGETVEVEVMPSPYLHLSGGVNYTGTEGFVFMATTGYAVLLEDNTRLVGGSQERYEQDIRPLYEGGIILSVAFGYAF